ncbi:hypothetical protein ALC62_06809 [Cyphomyrmex costatus]|uniref:Uncharacterized protein n=1 Tax=Cyphomyrmex costatus TaxID=456900 RepID=A0A195CQP1_9HYME|nr:hypothetical protein ALC62_06809 [Cyphomyrmex costatus]
MRMNTILPSSGSSRRKPRSNEICGPPAVVRFVTGVALTRQNVLHFNEQRQIHVLSFSVFLPKGPTGRTSIHVLMPARYGHNDGNVFILPTLRHDDRSTN